MRPIPCDCNSARVVCALMACEVSTPVFCGPFEQLVALIRRGELDLWAVSLAELAAAFLAALGADPETAVATNLDEATEFVSTSAGLIELKARRLLPDESDLDLHDDLHDAHQRDLLLARLVEGHTFRGVGGELWQMIGRASRSHARRAGLVEERFLQLAPDLLQGVRGEDLKAAFVRVTAPRPEPQVDVSHLADIELTVDEAVADLTTELSTLGRISFGRLTSGITVRMEVVVRFLAVLEMVKQGLADVRQDATFGDIVIVWTGDDHGLSLTA